MAKTGQREIGEEGGEGKGMIGMLEWFFPREMIGERKREKGRVLGTCGGGIKASSGNPGLAERSDAGLRKDLFEIFCCRQCRRRRFAMLQQLGSVWCTNNKK